MSLEKKYEEVKKNFKIDPESLILKIIKDYQIDRYVGHGNNGIVFHGINKFGFHAAIKIIPLSNLKNEWMDEFYKLRMLDDIPGVAKYRDSETQFIKGVNKEIACLCILYQFINGKNLNQYLVENPGSITIIMVLELIKQVLAVFQAMKVAGINHGDLHKGNIMVANPDEKFISLSPRFVITDFGQGQTTKRIIPKDDYFQLSLMCNDIMNKYIVYSSLTGKDKFIFDQLKVFLDKELIEKNKLLGIYIENPRELYRRVDSIEKKHVELITPTVKLTRPFDFLSCEQIGDSYELLNELYTSNFPGYNDLLEKMTTILTGPRGCGKTTIFKNLSLKTTLLTNQHTLLDPLSYIGVYYNCKDLYFAFPYEIHNINDLARKQVVHYFNLALLYEILDALYIASKRGLDIPLNTYDRLQGFFQAWFDDYQLFPSENNGINHLISFINHKKQVYRDNLATDDAFLPAATTPEYFLINLSKLLQDGVPWMKDIPFYIFLDDYSTPRIHNNLQKILNCILFNRNPEIIFKIATESIVSLEFTDATGKLLEQDREYDIIDFGDYFLHSSKEVKSEFLKDIINKRLNTATEYDWTNKDIVKILNSNIYDSYNDMARRISSNERIRYCGWDTIVDLCSGDIATILRLTRDIFTYAEAQSIKEVIPDYIQDNQIRSTGNTFLTRIEAIPEHGLQLRKITDAFGEIASYYLRTRKSKNVKTNPPHQAFRIEIQDPLYFDDNIPQTKLGSTYSESQLKELYFNLIRYGIFIRDVKGKSQRGAVVPRLYLRRLLIPTFLLTPSSRDSIRLEVKEFKLLLSNPTKFIRRMKRKKARTAPISVKKLEKYPNGG